MRNLTPEEHEKILSFIQGDVRFRGMSIRDAEALAYSLLYKWKEDAKREFGNFLEDMKNDARMIVEGLKARGHKF